MRFYLLLIMALCTVGLAAQPVGQRDFERYREVGLIYLDAGQYDKALENLLLALAAPDRRPDENIAPLIHDLQDRWATALRRARQAQKADEARLRTLEEEYARVWQHVRAIQDTAARSAAQAQANQQQITAFRLAILADQARLSGTYQEALLLAAKARELADDYNRADIMYYFSLVVRDSFFVDLPVSDDLQALSMLPNQLVLQYEKKLTSFSGPNYGLEEVVPNAVALHIEGEEALLSFSAVAQQTQYFDSDQVRWIPLQATHLERLTSARMAGAYRLTTSRDNTAKLWDTSGQLVADFTGHSGNVYQALLLNSQRKVVTRSSDGTLRLWDANGAYLRTLTRQAYIYQILVDPLERQLLAATASGEVLRWQPHALERPPIVQRVSDQPVVELHWCGPEQQYWLSRDARGQLKFWDQDGDLMATPVEGVSGLRVLPDNGQVLVWTDSGLLQLYTDSGQLVRRWQAHEASLVGVDYDPVQQTILTTAYDRTVKWWTLDGEQILHWPLVDNLGSQHAIFSSDYKSVLVPYFLPGRISIHKLPTEVLAEITAVPLTYPPDFEMKYGID
jgi:tetratricopeptide (TPR) repeat protein